MWKQQNMHVVQKTGKKYYKKLKDHTSTTQLNIFHLSIAIIMQFVQPIQGL